MQANSQQACVILQAGAPAAMEVSGDEWTGEMYEEDKESAFHKFCQCMQRIPQQCVRYRSAPTNHPCLACGTAQRCIAY